MAKPPAERMRGYRARRRAGLVVLPVEVEVVAVIEALIEANLLKPTEIEDQKAVARAVGSLVERVTRNGTPLRDVP